MAVSHDASSESHTGTTGSTSEASFTWNHTVSASAKGAWVGVWTLADADYVSGVTLGGVSMTRVTVAADTATEPMRVTLYFLANPPTGSQAVVVSRTNNATSMYGVCHTVIASTTVEVYSAGIVLLQENQTLAEQNVTDGSPGTNSLRFAFVGSGHSTAVPAGANSTIGQGILIGTTTTCRSYYETVAGQGSRPVGSSSGTSDDVAGIYFAIREVPLVAYTLSCSAGSYTYTGITATFSAARGMSGTAGSYVYTGKDSTLVIARSLSAAAGSYVYTGKDATLSKATGSTAYSLTADNGSYIYTGNAATFLYVPIATNKGSFSDYKFTRQERERLARLRYQQSRIRDDEEALAIILTSLIRR